MPEEKRSIRLRIEGRVQGVGFRAFVERAATARGLDGFVRNRRDGGVEVVLAGQQAAVEEAVALIRRGPRGARVDMARIIDEVDLVPTGFSILPTI